MTNHARLERFALCELFLDVGPDAPTLDEGWTTRDLAAHLVVRETRPDAAAGILVKPFAAYGESVRRRIGQCPWEALVATIRSGPPRWSPTRLEHIDMLVNTIEFFVHHEDVRRARDGWTPRPLDPDLARQLWRLLGRMSRLLARRAPCGVVFVNTSGARITAKSAAPVVEVVGDVGELVLFAYGRQRHAHVSLNGPTDAAALLRNAKLGM